jgi:hypothetical protein
MDNSIFTFDLRKLSTFLEAFQNDSMGGKGKGIHSLDFVETDSFKGVLGGSIKNAFMAKSFLLKVSYFLYSSVEPGFTSSKSQFFSKGDVWGKILESLGLGTMEAATL